MPAMTDKAAEDSIRELISHLGDDPGREGLQETPKRYLKFLREFLEPQKFNFTTFENDSGDDMIVQTGIPFHSLCEHHLAPFFGFASVAYIPKKRIVGLSKLARCVDHFARRFQNQERITFQIAEELTRHLDPGGVAVTLTARHFCMEMRGIKKPGTTTTTSRMTGAFFENVSTRAEFYSLIRRDSDFV